MKTCDSTIASTSSIGVVDRPRLGGYVIRPLMQFTIGWIIVMLFASAARSADSVYQCIPSGFSVGVAPIQGPFRIQDQFELSGPISFGAMRDAFAGQLARSSLFSEVAVFTEGTHPESTDLSLLLTIPTIREFSDTPPHSYEILINVLLVENVGGATLYSRDYPTRYEPLQTMTAGLSNAIRFSADIQITFAKAIPRMIADLNIALNEDSDFLFSQLARMEVATPSHLEPLETVTHSHLEPLWMVPIVAENASAGLENYSRLVEANLSDRLSKKDCFSFLTIADSVSECIAGSAQSADEQSVSALQECLRSSDLNQGLVLVTFLYSEGFQNRIRTILLHLPTLDPLYDRSSVTSPGWRLGNTLEKHAAGIAQASHTIPH